MAQYCCSAAFNHTTSSQRVALNFKRDQQRCHYMTRVGGREGPHATCAFLILILHGPPSCYTSTYTCRR